jgi:hypothetical protein
MWKEHNCSGATVAAYSQATSNHVLSQTLHLHYMRTFLHKQATIDHVQTCIDLAVVDIFIGLRAKDTPLPMQQDREPLLDM